MRPSSRKRAPRRSRIRPRVIGRLGRNEVASRVLTNIAGSAVIEAENVTAGATYFVEVVSSSAFDITVDFTTRSTTTDLAAHGDASTEAQTANLAVGQSQTIHFALSATGDNGASIVLTVRDSAGNIVYVLSAAGGTSRSSEVFLAAGNYTVEVKQIAAPDYTGGPLSYRINGWGITDPIGALPVDNSGGTDGGNGGGNGSGGSPSPGLEWVVNSGTTGFWL